MSVGQKLLPIVGKIWGLPALAGLASEGASQIVKKITGCGMHTSPFMVPFEKERNLVPISHLLTAKQYGEGIGTVLGSIWIPIALDLIKKISDGGALRMGMP